ncbi:MAG: hypothetical protein QOG98_3455, partial [Pseudonocardiales bacterium]|nr:hypothetical protein [Pseudonocardiales bacterium]
ALGVGHERAGVLGGEGESSAEFLGPKRGQVGDEGGDAVGWPPGRGMRGTLTQRGVEPWLGLDEYLIPIGDHRPVGDHQHARDAGGGTCRGDGIRANR